RSRARTGSAFAATRRPVPPAASAPPSTGPPCAPGVPSPCDSLRFPGRWSCFLASRNSLARRFELDTAIAILTRLIPNFWRTWLLPPRYLRTVELYKSAWSMSMRLSRRFPPRRPLDFARTYAIVVLHGQTEILTQTHSAASSGRYIPPGGANDTAP